MHSQARGANENMQHPIDQFMSNDEDEGGNSTENLTASNDEGTDQVDLNENPQLVLGKLRAGNPNRPIIGHINVNFLAPKFESLKSLIEEKLDILVVTETKLDESFP